MKRLTLSLLTLAVLASAGLAQAQQRNTGKTNPAPPSSIGLIDMAHVFQNYEKFKDMREQLQAKIAESDAREIVLTGVNVGDFGSGTGETFFDLIRALDTLNGIDRIRISSIEPNLLTDDIIRFCAASNLFVPHFHIPLQSGSNKVLSEMRRRYKRELFTERVHRIKTKMPDAAIGVDVIVGFPTETDKDFQDTFDFLQALDITYLHVFSYSERPNTMAQQFPEKIEKHLKAERSKILHTLSDEKRKIFHQKFIGQTRNILFETMKSGLVYGHTDNYILTAVSGDKKMINQILSVKLFDGNHITMKGKLYH